LDKQNIYHKESYIIHEGDTDTSLFVVEKGSVRLVRTSDDGEPREFMQMGVGSIFGELSLITGLPRTCSVIANEECVILELTKESFDKLTHQFQNLRVKLAQLVEQRLRENQKVTKEILTPRSPRTKTPVVPLLKVVNNLPQQ
jgi:CRP-like cAMP-binding protein